ncbi:MAG: Hcp family type VI secretion system effector [Phycisphaerae bacterium]
MPEELNIQGWLCLEPDKGAPIEGESQDAVHKGELQVVSFGFGVSNPRTASTGEGDSKPDFHELTVGLVASKASPALMLAVARGDHFKKATLSLRKHGASKTNADYVQVQVSDVYITSHTWGGGDSARPTESITLSYMTIDFYYAQQDADGALKHSCKRAWSIDNNKDTPSQLPYTAKKGS